MIGIVKKIIGNFFRFPQDMPPPIFMRPDGETENGEPMFLCRSFMTGVSVPLEDNTALIVDKSRDTLVSIIDGLSRYSESEQFDVLGYSNQMFINHWLPWCLDELDYGYYWNVQSGTTCTEGPLVNLNISYRIAEKYGSYLLKAIESQ